MIGQTLEKKSFLVELAVVVVIAVADLENEEWLVTDLLGFQTHDYSCYLLTDLIDFV